MHNVKERLLYLENTISDLSHTVKQKLSTGQDSKLPKPQKILKIGRSFSCLLLHPLFWSNDLELSLASLFIATGAVVIGYSVNFIDKLVKAIAGSAFFIFVHKKDDSLFFCIFQIVWPILGGHRWRGSG